MKKQKNYLNKDGKLFLNVASSTEVLPDFVNIDNHIFLRFLTIYAWIERVIPSKYHAVFQQYTDARRKVVLIRHDCRERLPFSDSSVDHILCSHFLEHVYPEEMETILSDFYRVLKPAATLHVVVPDIEKEIHAYLDQKEQGNAIAADELIRWSLLSRETRGTLKYRLLEFLGAFGLQHRWMYDNASMRQKIALAGFEIVKVSETPSHFFRADDDSVHVGGKKKDDIS